MEGCMVHYVMDFQITGGVLLTSCLRCYNATHPVECRCFARSPSQSTHIICAPTHPTQSCKPNCAGDQINRVV